MRVQYVYMNTVPFETQEALRFLGAGGQVVVILLSSAQNQTQAFCKSSVFLTSTPPLHLLLLGNHTCL